MHRKLLTILICMLTVLTVGQPSKLFSIDFESQFDGGIKGFTDFIVNNVTYPMAAKEGGRQGTVVVGFILTKDAKITDIKVKNSIGLGCDEETIRLLKLMEGKLKSKANSDQYFEFNTKFKLEGEKNISKLIQKADKLYSKEKYTDALLLFDEILRLSPYNVDILLKRGVSRQKTADKSGACADWTRIKELKENIADNYIAEYCK